MRIDSVVTQLYRVRPNTRTLRKLFWPSVHQSQFPAGAGVATQTDVQIPLWLLAIVCLVWPVTTFIITRRHKRGFPVEATSRLAADPEPQRCA